MLPFGLRTLSGDLLKRLYLLDELFAPSVIMSALRNRLKAATLGFCITVAPLAIVATAHLIFMPQVVAAMEILDSNERAQTVAYLRSDWFTMYSIVTLMFATYWLMAAVCVRGQPNYSLGAGGVVRATDHKPNYPHSFIAPRVSAKG